MALGLGVLGLAPAAFWSMTLAELSSAVRGRTGRTHVPVLRRDELDDLMARFPDAAPDPTHEPS